MAASNSGMQVINHRLVGLNPPRFLALSSSHVISSLGAVYGIGIGMLCFSRNFTQGPRKTIVSSGLSRRGQRYTS